MNLLFLVRGSLMGLKVISSWLARPLPKMNQSRTLGSLILLFVGICLALSPADVYGQRNVRKRRERQRKVETTPLPAEETPAPTKPADERVYRGRSALVKGRVIDADDKSPLISASVKYADSPVGALTDFDGNFTLPVTGTGKVTLLVSYIGYTTSEIQASSGQPIEVKLKAGTVATEEVVISSSRISERLKESNTSISKVTLAEVRSSTSSTVYENIANLRELDGVNIGVGYRVYNARGFLAVINNRFSQRYDGMEFLIPGNNASAGNLLGPSDIDVENAEVIVGPASALYGSSAVNGLLNIRTRSPFDFTGLTYSVKTGANHLSGSDFSTQPIFDVNMRYAAKLTKKASYKFSLASFIAQDWVGSTAQDGTNYAGTTNDLRYSEFVNGLPSSQRAGLDPGYDGTSVFGDEVNFRFTEANFRGSEFNPTRPISSPQDVIRVGRTGYKEFDLGNYDFRSYKASFAIHYRPKPNRELVYSSSVAYTNTMSLIVTRDYIKDFIFHQHRIEYTAPRYYLRMYATLQSNPNLINMNALGASINRQYKADDNWFVQYLTALGPQRDFVNDLLRQVPGRTLLPSTTAPLDQQLLAVRNFADADNSSLAVLLDGSDNPIATYFTGGARLQPGTEAYDQARNRAMGTSINDGGARISDYTGFVNLDGQYDFSKKQIRDFGLQIGGSIRVYRTSSNGSYYSDGDGSIYPFEYGVFAQMNDDYSVGKVKSRLKGTYSIRIDGNQDISPRISPRVAFTYALDKGRKGFLRFSAQQAYRFPSLIQQFQDINLGSFRQIGTGNNALARYGLVDNNFLLTSLNDYTSSFIAGNKSPSLLQTQTFGKLKPELSRTAELGFRTSFDRGNTYIDLSIFYSTYDDFIGLVPVIGGVTLPATGEPVKLNPDNIFRFQNIANYQVWTNLSTSFQSYGYAVAAETYLSTKLKAVANLSYIRFQKIGDERTIGLVDAFNTPNFKSNIALYGSQIANHWSFGVSTRWVNSFEFVVPNFRGSVPSYAVVDAVLGYTFWGSGFHLKAGANNLLNHRHVEVTFGPTVGSSFFLQLVFDKMVYRK